MQAAREASWNILCKTSSREYVFTQCLRVYPHASDPFFAWILLLVIFSLGVASRIFRKQSGKLLPTHKHPADSIIKTELTSNPLLPYPASPTNLSSTTSKSPHSLVSSHTPVSTPAPTYGARSNHRFLSSVTFHAWNTLSPDFDEALLLTRKVSHRCPSLQSCPSALLQVTALPHSAFHVLDAMCGYLMLLFDTVIHLP